MATVVDVIDFMLYDPRNKCCTDSEHVPVREEGVGTEPPDCALVHRSTVCGSCQSYLQIIF